MRVAIALTAILVAAALTGCAGQDGANGKDGLNGRDGSNGLNGSVITTVQFCPDSSSYPNTFPEVGICIDGRLYAVYSSKAVLVLVPDGEYHSSSVGSKCNFKVEGCNVSR